MTKARDIADGTRYVAVTGEPGDYVISPVNFTVTGNYWSFEGFLIS